MTTPTRSRSFFTWLTLGLVAAFCTTFLLRLAFIFLASTPLAALDWSQKLHALVWGWHFDLAAVAVPLLIVSLIAYAALRLFRASRLPLWPFALVLALITLTQLSDTIYFLEAGRHSSYEIWALFGEAAGLASNAVNGHTGITLAALLLVVLFFWGAWGRKITIKRGVGIEVSLLVMLLICVYGLRGSLNERPMNPMRVFELANDAKAAIAENPIYSILYTLKEGNNLEPVYRHFPALPEDVYVDTLKQHFIHADTQLVLPSKQYNVILFALEAWPSWFMNDKRQGQPITPNFDRLARENFSTDGLLAEGHRTSEGVFSLLCSYPNPLGDAIIDNKLSNSHYHCLSKILTDSGWNTAIFQGMHTGAVGSMAQKLGITHSYGKHDIKIVKYPENGWGVDDHDIYNFMLKRAAIDEQKQPFFYIVNTMSTHDGTLPQGVPHVFGDKTRIDQLEGSLHYADAALGEFVEKLRHTVTRPTLLLITADHTRGPIPGRFNNYHTPFAMLVINGPSPHQYVPVLASQRDLAPTILDWLGGKAPWFTGQSLWQLPADAYQGNYYVSGVFGWSEGKHLIEFPLDKPAQLSCYQWDSASAQPQPAACAAADQARQVRARTWMHYSQKLLFDGKTASFGSPASLPE